VRPKAHKATDFVRFARERLAPDLRIYLKVSRAKRKWGIRDTLRNDAPACYGVTIRDYPYYAAILHVLLFVNFLNFSGLLQQSG
jgi:hypothetical protein